jgi:hypothetical protein
MLKKNVCVFFRIGIETKNNRSELRNVSIAMEDKFLLKANSSL